MKTHQLLFLTLLLTFFFTIDSIAQDIDSLKIIPSNPTTNNTIKVISYTTFTYGDCILGSSSVDIVDTNITVYTSYNTGLYPAICNSIDTLIIGILNAGIYELYCHLSDTAPPTTYDIDTIIFTVQQTGGLHPAGYTDQKINIYPNPFKTTATIFIDSGLLTSPLEIRIYDIFGREIRRISRIRKKEIQITKDNLTGGLYFIKVIRDDKIIDSRKIIIE